MSFQGENINNSKVSPTSNKGDSSVNAPQGTPTSSSDSSSAGPNTQTYLDGVEDQTKKDVTRPEGRDASKVVGKNMPGQQQELPGVGEIEAEKNMREKGTPLAADQILK